VLTETVELAQKLGTLGRDQRFRQTATIIVLVGGGLVALSLTPWRLATDVVGCAIVAACLVSIMGAFELLLGTLRGQLASAWRIPACAVSILLGGSALFYGGRSLGFLASQVPDAQLSPGVWLGVGAGISGFAAFVFFGGALMLSGLAGLESVTCRIWQTVAVRDGAPVASTKVVASRLRAVLAAFLGALVGLVLYEASHLSEPVEQVSQATGSIAFEVILVAVVCALGLCCGRHILMQAQVSGVSRSPVGRVHTVLGTSARWLAILAKWCMSVSLAARLGFTAQENPKIGGRELLTLAVMGCIVIGVGICAGKDPASSRSGDCVLPA
jgi:hypothetical protein